MDYHWKGRRYKINFPSSPQQFFLKKNQQKLLPQNTEIPRKYTSFWQLLKVNISWNLFSHPYFTNLSFHTSQRLLFIHSTVSTKTLWDPCSEGCQCQKTYKSWPWQTLEEVSAALTSTWIVENTESFVMSLTVFLNIWEYMNLE